MKPIQFVWFTGHSAVGKQQTIDGCLKAPSWAEQTFGIRVTEGVQQLQVSQLDEKSLEGASGCILLKWQYCTNDKIRQLHEDRPNDQHVVILLLRETEEHFTGFVKKFQEAYRNDPEQLAIYKNPVAARKKFLDDRILNEGAARANKAHAGLYLEFCIENGIFRRVE